MKNSTREKDTNAKGQKKRENNIENWQRKKYQKKNSETKRTYFMTRKKTLKQQSRLRKEI